MPLSDIPISQQRQYVLQMAITPIQPADETARQMAKDIMGGAIFASLGVLHPQTGSPFVTRIAFWLAPDGLALSLMSGMASHTGALKNNPACSVLIGEPPPKGDPLAFPRLTLQANAVILPRADLDTRRADYLKARPKAKLYIDLPDFRFIRFDVASAFLNAGFGKAFNLTPADLA